jgi:D-3-phosphoglycerate dehydrogenase
MSNTITQPTVLVTARRFDPAALAYLDAQGCHVIAPALNGGDPAPDSLPGLLQGIDAWIVGGTNVDRALMEANPALQIIARRGVGYEQIDTEAARALGRVVTIAAGGNGPSVADHTLGLMLAVAKQMAAFTQRMRAGDWSYAIGSELYGKTVGIIGLGRVGRLVARRLAGFDVTLLATDIAPDAAAHAASQGIPMVTLPELLRQSDYVTLHAPLDTTTRGMMDEAAFAQMKPGAILINTARGGLVHEDALLAALQTGRLAGAGLDVFEAEKDPAHNQAALALCALPNVVATPHTAAATHEGLARTNLIAARTVVALLAGTTPPPDCIVVDGRI